MLLTPKDNVSVDLENGHKYAERDIAKGEKIIKYGFPIGYATEDIKKGDHVHSHNMKTSLGEKLEYKYEPKGIDSFVYSSGKAPVFMGYRRKNGEVGIRNDVWIINTVGCVNKASEKIAEATGAFAFVHPFGCSQLGGDKDRTETVLSALIRHPNAGGVLVLGLGCENSNIGEIKKKLEGVDLERVRFLSAQDTEDEIAEGIKLVKELQEIASRDEREEIPAHELKVGLKCGGSDGYSGITANPLVGRFCDALIADGGTAALTEVPEMFGAETILMQRCVSYDVFQKNVELINNFKAYFESHGQPVYENPSPGNKAGGITTLEEKSLGCVQKGGTAPVVDVLPVGERIEKKGLNLVDGPGNDIVACTNLTAAGCHLILFTTGRGTPLGAPVPTVKIATNALLAEKKKNWIDFDASPTLDGAPLTKELYEYVLSVASGKLTKNEEHGYREISIFKDGVTL